MPSAQIAASHYEPDGPGDGRKLCVNLYAEKNPQDPARPFRLVPTPGSRLIDNGSTLTTAVRGVAQADGFASGKLVVVDGTTVRLMDTAAETWSALTGTLPGTDRAQIVFGEVQAGFLANGALYQSTGTAVAALTDGDWATLLSDHSQTAFTSVAVIGQRLVATYGSRFAFSSALDFDNTTTLSYYTAENAPDGIVGAFVIGDILYIVGTQTIEPWVQTGDNDDPFRPLTGQVIRRGTAARDTMTLLDNSLFLVADDRTVRRLDGLVPTILNKDDAWVTRLLSGVSASDLICKAIETDAHSFYQINAPTICIVYDIASQTWHERSTQAQDTWEWAYIERVNEKFYAGSRLDTKLAQISRAYLSDDMADATTFGTEIIRSFTAHLPVKMGRNPMSLVRLEGTKGVGLSTGQGSAPTVNMAISRDKGITYGSERSRSLGAIGEYGARTIWRQCGRAAPEQTVMKFSWSDPVNFSPTGVMINEQ